MRRRSAAPDDLFITVPSTVTVPLVGAIRPAIIRSVVVLPAPFGPSRATISPRATLNVTSLTTIRGPKLRISRDVAITGVSSQIREPSYGRLPALWRRSPRTRIELEQTGRDEQPAFRREVKAGGCDQIDAAELHRADLVAVRVEDVGERIRERDPELSLAIDCRSAHRRPNHRQFAVLSRPSRRQPSDQRVGFDALHPTLEHEPADRRRTFERPGRPA